MSTTKVTVSFVDEFYDGQNNDPGTRNFQGVLSYNHTSDTVQWTVDGQFRWIISPAELSALGEAIDKVKASI
jgi:hypothetical protein